MNTHDRITLGGFVALAALTVALFAWLRADIAAVDERLGAVEERLGADIAAVEEGLGADIAAVEEGLGADIAAVEERLGADIERLDARMEQLENGQIDLRERMARLEGELSAVLTIVDVATTRDAPPSGETAE